MCVPVTESCSCCKSALSGFWTRWFNFIHITHSLISVFLFFISFFLLILSVTDFSCYFLMAFTNRFFSFWIFTVRYFAHVYSMVYQWSLVDFNKCVDSTSSAVIENVVFLEWSSPVFHILIRKNDQKCFKSVGGNWWVKGEKYRAISISHSDSL